MRRTGIISFPLDIDDELLGKLPLPNYTFRGRPSDIDIVCKQNIEHSLCENILSNESIHPTRK